MSGKNEPKIGKSAAGVQTRTGGKLTGIPSLIPRDPVTPSTPSTPSGTEGDDRIQEILNKLDKLKQLDDLEDRIDKSTEQLKEEIEKNNEKAEKVSNDCAKVKDETAILKTQVSVHGLRLSDLETKIEQLEQEKRRITLIIEGVKEQEDEDIVETVENIFKATGVDYNTRVCINVYRRGRKPRDDHERRQSGQQQQQQTDRARPRPIVIVYLRQTEKGEIFSNLKNLKGKDEWKYVYFNDDLTELQAAEQRDLRSLVAYAKSLGKEANVKANAFWYEGRKYKYEELHRLPDEISLLKPKIYTS